MSHPIPANSGRRRIAVTVFGTREGRFTVTHRRSPSLACCGPEKALAPFAPGIPAEVSQILRGRMEQKARLMAAEPNERAPYLESRVRAQHRLLHAQAID